MYPPEAYPEFCRRGGMQFFITVKRLKKKKPYTSINKIKRLQHNIIKYKTTPTRSASVIVKTYSILITIVV